MSAHTHAVPSGSQAQPGRCSWTWHWEDVDLRCTDRVVPGSDLCAEHLIERHAKGPAR